MPKLTSTDNAAVKDLVRLHTRRGRREAGQALLEGPHLLMEALAAGRPISQVFFLDDWAAGREGKDLLARAGKSGAVLCPASARVLAKITTTDTPPPVAATIPLALTPAAPAAAKVAGLLVDGLQDPGNLGTILRTAWGAGLETVWVTASTVDLYAPKVLRAALGAHFHLSLREIGRDECLSAIEHEGWRLVAMEPGAPTPFWRAAFHPPCLICIGGEARGIDPDLRRAAAEAVSIPLAAGVDSLNAAISAGIALFELVRRRGMGGE
ncbi:MAG: TrmH family RNA methyltransferase [Patescibacteria group bacterium]